MPILSNDPQPYVVKGENNTWRVSESEAAFMLNHPSVYADRFTVTFAPRTEELSG